MSGGILTYRTHGHRVVLSQGEGIGTDESIAALLDELEDMSD